MEPGFNLQNGVPPIRQVQSPTGGETQSPYRTSHLPAQMPPGFNSQPGLPSGQKLAPSSEMLSGFNLQPGRQPVQQFTSPNGAQLQPSLVSNRTTPPAGQQQPVGFYAPSGGQPAQQLTSQGGSQLPSFAQQPQYQQPQYQQPQYQQPQYQQPQYQQQMQSQQPQNQQPNYSSSSSNASAQQPDDDWRSNFQQSPNLQQPVGSPGTQVSQSSHICVTTSFRCVVATDAGRCGCIQRSTHRTEEGYIE
jgi:hypothetical protein